MIILVAKTIIKRLKLAYNYKIINDLDQTQQS